MFYENKFDVVLDDIKTRSIGFWFLVEKINTLKKRYTKEEDDLNKKKTQIVWILSLQTYIK